MDRGAPLGDSRADRTDPAAAKGLLRARLKAARAAAPEDPAATRHRTELALAACQGHEVVACYAATGDEPDTWPLIDALAVAGVAVLLPVLGRRPDGSVRREPDWARYTGRRGLRTGLWGIPEPTGPALGPGGLAGASFVWCSALAATPDGHRLGVGGGWYDRALVHAAFGATIGALVRAAEVLDDVPVDPWDRPIDLIVTESALIRCRR